MAFSFVGGAINSANASSASITHGLTINSGHLVVAYINRNDAITISNDAGGTAWTEAMQETPPSETAKHALFWKIAGGSEPATYSWTLNGTDLYQAHLRVFSSTSDAVVDAAASTDIRSSSEAPFIADAIDGAVISDDAVSLIFAGMDRDGGSFTVDTADNSYVSALGSDDSRYAGSAHRIYTTGTTFSGAVTLGFTGSAGNDDCYSVHISFVEGGSAANDGAAVYHYMRMMGVYS